MKIIKKYFVYIFLIFLSGSFFYPFFLNGKLPIPADTVIGLYHPFRDLYVKDYPNGVPYKNFLITDPVRQQFPWKKFAIDSVKKGTLPVWNSYEMSGKPQLANFQTGVFYPLNILLFISPFPIAWSLFITIQPILAILFMYLYLKSLKINTYASILGSICFAFSGFMIAWLEWGVIGHTYMWLPLLFMSIDRGFMVQNIKWKLIFILALSSSFFAGHLQTFSYMVLATSLYFLARLFYKKKKAKIAFSYLFDLSVVGVITFIQWFPTFRFLQISNRAFDQSFLQEGWFIPWNHMVMFLAPDFFGNPSTLNYYGVWNYAEFVGYIGVSGLLLALYALIFRRDKKTYFFLFLLLFSIIFSTSNFISKIPYILQLPFIASAQPTRLIGIASFSLSVLAALGFDFFIIRRFKIWVPSFIVGIGIITLFVVSNMPNFFPDSESLSVAQNNLKLPILLFLLNVSILFLIQRFKTEKWFKMLFLVLLIVTVFDLFRFGWKFTPFSAQEYLFPETKTISFLEKNIGFNRIAILDDRILPPNFQTMYKIRAISGYDPLYLFNYAELIAANERGDHSITPPFGYNRILNPKNYETQIFDLLNVKYVLSLAPLESKKMKLVFEEGQTKVYENKEVLPLAFFVKNVKSYPAKNIIAQEMFKSNLSETAFTQQPSIVGLYATGSATIIDDSPYITSMQVESEGDGFLVVSQIYYPNILITIDGKKTEYYEVNMALVGVKLSAGKHTLELKRSLF